MHASNYLEGLIARFFLSTALTKPAAHYLALFSTLPAEDGSGGVELSGNGYARQRYGPGDANWSAPVNGNGLLTNLLAVVYPTPTANWPTIVGFGIYDALSGGNPLILAPLETPLQVNLGDPAPAFAPGDLTLTIA